MCKELTKVRKLYKLLLRQKEHKFPMPGETITASTKRGVYIIVNRKGLVLHVGKTARAKRGIKQRLNDHLHGRSSFTKRYLGGNGSKLRGTYWYKFLEVTSPRLRALLEAYAIANLCPRHLGLGNVRRRATENK